MEQLLCPRVFINHGKQAQDGNTGMSRKSEAEQHLDVRVSVASF